MKIGIIVSQFDKELADKLLDGSKRGLDEASANYDVIEVPGVFEIPLAALRLAKSKKYDALITLGVVIKGKTDHYDMICRACTDGIREVMMTHEIPIAFEVLMVRSREDAMARCGGDKADRGYEAAKVALAMLKM